MVGGADAERQARGQVKAGLGPAGGAGRIDVQGAIDVVQQLHQHPVPGGRHSVEGLGGARLGDQGCGAVGRIIGRQRAGPEGRMRRGRSPGFVDGDDHPAGHIAAQFRMFRQVQQAQGPVRLHQAPFALEEGGAALDQHLRHLTLGRPQHPGAGPHVGGRAAIDLHGLGLGLPPPQALDHEGVAGLGQGPRSPVPGDQHRVGVQPLHILLAAGEAEAAGDEAAAGNVELADLRCVAAPVGQAHEAAGLGGRQAVRALEDPVPALGLRQGVEIQQGLPDRGRRGVAGRGRDAPDALHMGVVLPEIGDPVAQEAGGGDAVPGGEQGQRLPPEGLVAGIGLQPAGGARVLGRDPGQGPGAVHLLQPAIGIRRAGGGGRNGLGRGGGGGQQQGGQHRPHRGSELRQGHRDHAPGLRASPATGARDPSWVNENEWAA